MRALLTALVLTAASLACGSPPAAAGGAAEPSAPRPARGAANLINSGEIEAAPENALNALDLVRMLRPTMLRSRSGPPGNDGIVVYVDDIRLGTTEQLATVMRPTVLEIRYLSANDATTRWGTGHPNGAIQIRLKRGP